MNQTDVSRPQVSKTLKATLAALLDNMCESDCNPSPDVPSSLSHEPLGGNAAPKLTLAKRRANQQETETYYFTVSRCRWPEAGTAALRVEGVGFQQSFRNC